MCHGRRKHITKMYLSSDYIFRFYIHLSVVSMLPAINLQTNYIAIFYSFLTWKTQRYRLHFSNTMLICVKETENTSQKFIFHRTIVYTHLSKNNNSVFIYPAVNNLKTNYIAIFCSFYSLHLSNTTPICCHGNWKRITEIYLSSDYNLFYTHLSAVFISPANNLETNCITIFCSFLTWIIQSVTWIT